MMDSQSHFLRQTDYHLWANQVLFDSLARLETEALHQSPSPQSPSIVQAADLLLMGLRLWASVLQQTVPMSDNQPLLHVSWRGLKRRLQLELRAFRHWLEARPESWFDESVTYTRPGGELRTDTVRDLLAQLLNLFTHYRAHIAALAVRLGAPVAPMDYLCFVWDMQRVAQEELDPDLQAAPPAPAAAAAAPPAAARTLVYSLSFTAPGIDAITRAPILLSLDGGTFSTLPPWGPWPGA